MVCWSVLAVCLSVPDALFMQSYFLSPFSPGCSNTPAIKGKIDASVFVHCMFFGLQLTGWSIVGSIDSENVPFSSESRLNFDFIKQLSKGLPLNVLSINYLVKGAVCKSWPPVEFIFQTNRGQHITWVITNCYYHYLYLLFAAMVFFFWLNVYLYGNWLVCGLKPDPDVYYLMLS